MSIGAELGQYILLTQFKKILKIQWRGFERRWAYLKLPQGWTAG